MKIHTIIILFCVLFFSYIKSNAQTDTVTYAKACEQIGVAGIDCWFHSFTNSEGKEENLDYTWGEKKIVNSESIVEWKTNLKERKVGLDTIKKSTDESKGRANIIGKILEGITKYEEFKSDNSKTVADLKFFFEIYQFTGLEFGYDFNFKDTKLTDVNIQIKEEVDTVVKPVDTNTVVKPVDTNTVVKPVDTNTVVKPVDTNTVVKPENIDTVVKKTDNDKVSDKEAVVETVVETVNKTNTYISGKQVFFSILLLLIVGFSSFKFYKQYKKITNELNKETLEKETIIP